MPTPKKKSAPEEICRRCARCCGYFCMEIDTPKTRGEFDDLIWILAHEDVAYHVTKDEWSLIVHNRCRFLDPASGCQIYDVRPRICRQHPPGDCERDQKHRHDYEDVERVITSIPELQAYRDDFFKEKRRKAALKAARRKKRMHAKKS
jgi:Fe-S-cluster containining protein